MRYPWANTALLVLLVFQLITGFGGLVSGAEGFRWVLSLHSIGGYAVVAILFWKSLIIVDVLFRRKWRLNFSRLGFLLLSVIVAVILTTGLVWTFTGPIYVLGFSLMTIHALLALGLIALLTWHTVAKRFILRQPHSRDRRAFLRLAGITAAGILLWRTAPPVKAALDLSGARRRFTGSYERGSFTGVFPEVIWLFDNPAPVDVENWQLIVGGAVERPLVIAYEQLSQFRPQTITATVDCTGGWYSTQEWAGIKLADVLEWAGAISDAASVTVESVTGYGRRYSMEDARAFLLAVQVGGGTLSHRHGFPLRLVAPGYRGFDWVKWVAEIRVNETGRWWQLPVPLQ